MAYTDLIKIDRPLGTELSPIAYLNAKATAGSVVEIYVYIKNQHSAAIGVMPRAIINGSIEAVFTVPYANIPAGYTYYFTGRFTMPNVDANIRAESYYYGVDGQWHFEDYQTRTINLEAIETKRLVINRSPTAGGTVVATPLPTTGTVYDGYYPKNTTVYVMAYPSPSYRFKEWSGELSGTSPSSSVYMSENRTITANFELVPVYNVTITSKYIRYDSVNANIPASSIPQGKSIDIRVKVRNDSSVNVKPCIALSVADPGGLTIYTYQICKLTDLAPGVIHDEFVSGNLALSKVGTYRVRIDITIEGSSVIYDQYDDVLCTVISAVIPTVLHSVTASTTKPTVDYGATVPYILGYTYKGEAQGGTLKVEAGTGTALTGFTPAAVVSEGPYNFTKQTSEVPKSENKTFTVPSGLTRGQTYAMRVTLTTADGLHDDDVYWSAFKVLDITVPSTDLQALAITTQYRDYALGENLPCSISFKYKGIAQGGTIQASIKKGLALVYTYPLVTMQFERADTLTTVTREVNLELPRTLEPGQVYSLRIEIVTSDGKDTSETKGSAFAIASGQVPTDPGVGTYRMTKDYTYPYAEGYRGACSEATVEITVPLAQLPGMDWISQRVVDGFESKVAENGAHMLKLMVYEREHGLTSVDYKLIATATTPKETAGQAYTPQGIVSLAYVTPLWGHAAWALIILGILLALGFIISAVVPSVREGVWGEGGLVETVTDIGSLLGDIIPMMVIMMMLMLVMEQTREIYEPAGAPPRPKPITEAAVKTAKWVGKKAVPVAIWVGKEAVDLAQKGWEEAKGLVVEAKREWEEASKERKAEKREEIRRAEEREEESREKLREAKAELRRRREEQAKGEQQA